MTQKPIKIAYLPDQFRVRVEFSKSDCMQQVEPPPELLERAKIKLRRERKRGHVAFYRIFKTRLYKLWEILRASNLPLDAKVAVTLVTGAPPMPGLIIGPASRPGHLANLSFVASPETLNSWRYELVKLTVGKLLRTMGIKTVADPAQIHSAWIRACRGETIKDFGLSPLSIPQGRTPFELRWDSASGDLALVIHDVKRTLETATTGSVVEAVRAKAAEIKASTGKTLQILDKRIINTLNSANRGPERYGIDLPLVVLAGLTANPHSIPRPATPKTRKTSVSVSAPTPNSQPTAAPKFEMPALAKAITIEISSDSLTATITAAETAYFESMHKFEQKDWDHLLRSLHIVAPLVDGVFGEIAARIQSGKSLVGLVLARGTPPTAGEQPHLALAYNRTATSQSVDDSAHLNFREQKRRTVQKGELIAKVEFRVKPTAGVSVLGKPLPPKPPAPLANIKVGDGIECRKDIEYYALFDGAPVFAGDQLSLTKSLIIPGNVNLATGNVHFHGPVEIKGSIEQGTVVSVHGDLTVHGMIQGGEVSATGDIKVVGGIATNHLALVRAGGNLSAEFIENSRVNCGKSLTVAKSIVSSQVTAGENITLTSTTGQIVGGELSCLNILTCANLGRASSALTSIRVGNHAEWEIVAARRQGRKAHLESLLHSETATLHEILQKSQAQMTERHITMKERLQKRTKHLNRLLRKMDQYIQLAKDKVTYNEAAKITVTGILSTNCRVEIAGNPVAVGQEVAAVEILNKRQNGSFIRSITESQTPAA